MGLPFVLDTLREETLTQFLVVPERGGQGRRGCLYLRLAEVEAPVLWLDSKYLL